MLRICSCAYLFVYFWWSVCWNIFGHFYFWVFLLLLSYKNSLCILDKIPVSYNHIWEFCSPESLRLNSSLSLLITCVCACTCICVCVWDSREDGTRKSKENDPLSKDKIVNRIRIRDDTYVGIIIQGLWSYNDHYVKSVWWKVDDICEQLGEFISAVEIIF